MLANPTHLPPSLRVGLQHVARPLPDVAQLVQLSAQGGIRPGAVVPTGPGLQEQTDGPFQVLVTPRGRRLLQGAAQDGQEILIPGGAKGMAAAVVQGTRRWESALVVQPVVDRLARDPEFSSLLGDRLSLVELQEGQAAAQQRCVVGGSTELPEAETLLGWEVQEVQGSPADTGSVGHPSALYHCITRCRFRPGKAHQCRGNGAFARRIGLPGPKWLERAGRSRHKPLKDKALRYEPRGVTCVQFSLASCLGP